MDISNAIKLLHGGTATAFHLYEQFIYLQMDLVGNL